MKASRKTIAIIGMCASAALAQNNDDLSGTPYSLRRQPGMVYQALDSYRNYVGERAKFEAQIVGQGGLYKMNPVELYAVWVAVLGRDDPMKRFAAENYLGMSNDLDGLDWVRVKSHLDRLKLAYGQDAIAAKAAAAFDGKPSADLAQANLDGYVRMLVLYHDQTIADEKTLLQKTAELERMAGSHETLVKVAKQVLDIDQANESFSSMGAGVNDAYSALTTTLQPVKPNNPYYLAWTHFPIGSKAVYVVKFGTVSSEYTFELQSITLQQAIIGLTKRNYDGRQWSKAYPSSMTLKAYYPPDQFAQSPAALLFARTSSEMWAYTWAAPQDEPNRATYPLGKTSLSCAVRMTDPNRSGERTETRFMSEHVPGGLVSVSEAPTNGTFLIGYSVVAGKSFQEPAEPAATVGQLAAVVADPAAATPTGNAKNDSPPQTTKTDPPNPATPKPPKKKKSNGILNRIFK